jgi:hypothetical protein
MVSQLVFVHPFGFNPNRGGATIGRWYRGWPLLRCPFYWGGPTIGATGLETSDLLLPKHQGRAGRYGNPTVGTGAPGIGARSLADRCRTMTEETGNCRSVEVADEDATAARQAATDSLSRARTQTLGGSGLSSRVIGRMTKKKVSTGMSPGIKATHGRGLGAKTPTKPSAIVTSTKIDAILPSHLRF